MFGLKLLASGVLLTYGWGRPLTIVVEVSFKFCIWVGPGKDTVLMAGCA